MGIKYFQNYINFQTNRVIIRLIGGVVKLKQLGIKSSLRMTRD